MKFKEKFCVYVSIRFEWKILEFKWQGIFKSIVSKRKTYQLGFSSNECRIDSFTSP